MAKKENTHHPGKRRRPIAEAHVMSARRSVWDEVADLLECYDGDLRLNTASECVWAGQLRLMLTNPERKPARSIVFFASGGIDPADIANRLLADAEDWLAKSEVQPLAPGGRS
jgi:hypothetical protein